MRTRNVRCLWSMVAATLIAAGCNNATGTSSAPPDASADAPNSALSPRDLDATLSWYGTNREKLNAMLAALGQRAATYNAANKPVAVFDWDNTVAKNDVGDATFFWMVKNGKVLQPAGKDWKTLSPYLTAAAVTALNNACDAAADSGKALPTGTNSACADELLSIYATAQTTGNLAAFAG